MLALEIRLSPRLDDIAADVLDGEAVIINLATGSYYSMNDAGALIWRAIEQHCSLDEIAARMVDSYDVTVEQARSDVRALAVRLLDEGIAQVSSAAAADGSFTASPQRLPYSPPELIGYTDMRDLLAMDPPMPSVDALTGSRDKP